MPSLCNGAFATGCTVEAPRTILRSPICLLLRCKWNCDFDQVADSSNFPFPAITTSKPKIFPSLYCTIVILGSSKKKKESLMISRLFPQMIMLNAVIKIKGKFTYTELPSLGDKSHRIINCQLWKGLRLVRHPINEEMVQHTNWKQSQGWGGERKAHFMSVCFGPC